MRSRFLNSVAAMAIAAVLGGAAKAADPSVADTYDWSGLYVGAHIGYGEASYDGIFQGGSSFGTDYLGEDLDLGGFIGGIHVGFNHQIDSIVIGIEGDVSLADWQDRLHYGNASTYSGHAGDINMLASIRGRIGFVPTERTLVFATAGAAFSDAKYTQYGSGDPTDSERAIVKFKDVGLVVGGGAEMAVTDNLRIRAEGLYYMFGDDKDTDFGLGSGDSGDFAGFDDAFTLRLGASLNF